MVGAHLWTGGGTNCPRLSLQSNVYHITLVFLIYTNFENILSRLFTIWNNTTSFFFFFKHICQNGVKRAAHSAVWKHKGLLSQSIFRNLFLTQLYQLLRQPVCVDKMFSPIIRNKVSKRERKSLERYSPETQMITWVGHGWARTVRRISILTAGVVCLHGRWWTFHRIPTERTVDCYSSECIIPAMTIEIIRHFHETADIIRVDFLVQSISTFKSVGLKTSAANIWRVQLTVTPLCINHKLKPQDTFLWTTWMAFYWWRLHMDVNKHWKHPLVCNH
jgi:hypothetical protein